MAVTIKELRRSRGRVSSGNPTEQRHYLAWGEEDADLVEAAVAAFAPSSIGSLVVDRYEQTPREERHDVFDCVVNYNRAQTFETPSTDDEITTFDISDQTINFRYSLATINSYGNSPPDFKQGVNFDGEDFKGADVFIPVFTFSVTKFRHYSLVTNAYIQSLAGLTGTRNNAAFRGFAAGEVLYHGANGSPRNADDWAITHRFAASPNVTGLQLGDITGIDKLGHDYLWVLYEQNEDGAANFVRPIPKAVYVERFYLPADFSQIGVAT